MSRRTVRSLTELIQAREVSVSKLVDQYLCRIQEHDSHYKAVSMISEIGVRLLAEKADRALDNDEQTGPLHGIPILVDDLIDVANMRTSYGSDAYMEYVPDVDSMAIRRLRAAGAIIMGKTRTAELGVMVNESEDSFISKSPWGDSLVSGGGSSGISVAQALNFAPVGVGIDVGGNVLLPAAFSGTFALKPTHGRIAQTPAFSRGLMFPDVTLVTSNVEDCALLMGVLSGASEVDPVCVEFEPQDFDAALRRSVRSLSIAHAPALWNAPFDDDHQSAIADVVMRLLAMGCRVERSRPPIANSIEAWKTVFCGNLFAEHGRSYSQHPDKFGVNASEWISRGERISASEYINAEKEILGLRLLLRTFFKKHDILIVPAAGCLPFEYGGTPSNISGEDADLRWYDYASVCAVGAISGYPTAVLPASRTDDGLPVGLLVIADTGNEDILMSVCSALWREHEDQTAEDQAIGL